MRLSPGERLDERRIEALRGIVGFIHFCRIHAYVVGFLAAGAENQRSALALLVVRAPTVELDRDGFRSGRLAHSCLDRR